MTDDLATVQADIAAWTATGARPWDLPAGAVRFALDCRGAEANPIGTMDALRAVSDKCGDCHGDGYHQDDSHPGNAATACEACGGHGRVAKREVDVTPGSTPADTAR